MSNVTLGSPRMSGLRGKIEVNLVLVKIATIMNDVYASVDVANLALMAYDGACGTQFSAQYVAAIASGSR